MFYVVSIFDKYKFEPHFYRGEDAINQFIKQILSVKDSIMKIINQKKGMAMTLNDIRIYNNSTSCHICEKALNAFSVRDHCHITGKFLGAAHNECNVNRHYKNFKIPVFFHNGRGYDSHFIINEIGKFEEIKRINMIPKMKRSIYAMTSII